MCREASSFRQSPAAGNVGGFHLMALAGVASTVGVMMCGERLVCAPSIRNGSTRARRREPGADNRKNTRNGRHVSFHAGLSWLSLPVALVRQQQQQAETKKTASRWALLCQRSVFPRNPRRDLSNVALKKRAEAQQDLDACDQKSRRQQHWDTRAATAKAHIPFRTFGSTTANQQHHRQPAAPASETMPSATTTPTSPAQTPLSVQRPALSPRKRKFSDTIEAASPTSLDEEISASSNNSSCSSSPLEERVISPKKKARAEERSSGDLSKWESHVVASLANALDLGSIDDCKDDFSEPIAFSAASAGDLAADELEILCHFLV